MILFKFNENSMVAKKTLDNAKGRIKTTKMIITDRQVDYIP